MTATTEQSGLLRTVLEAPHDDAPRLVYADWLDEYGEPERAELIQVQVKLAKDGFWPCGKPKCLDDHDYGLRNRERGLWPKVWTHFVVATGCVPYLQTAHSKADNGPISCVVRRGFVSAVRLPLAAFFGGQECENCGGTGLVDGDRYEQSEPCPDCGGEWGPSDEDNPTGVEPGTGRAPGLAAALFAAHPITEVTLTDRRPQQWSRDIGGVGDAAGRWFWCVNWGDGIPPAGRHAHYVPAEVRYSAEWTRAKWYHNTPTYDTEASANAALSRAVVAWARGLVGLPPLERE